MNAPEWRARDLFAPVTRVELDAALGAALQPIRDELAAVRRDIDKLYSEIDKLYGEIDKLYGEMHSGFEKLYGEMHGGFEKLYGEMYGEFEKLYGVVGDFREHFATKADVEAMGRRLVMWVGGLLAVFVAVMGWLVERG